MHWPNVNWVLPVLHQWTQWAAFATAVLLLTLMTLELRSTTRLRGLIARDLQRIFEQLDLARLETLRLAGAESALDIAGRRGRSAASGPAAVQRTAPPAAAEDRYQLAEQLARGGTEAREIASRCGLSMGEARMMIGVHGAISAMTGGQQA